MANPLGITRGLLNWRFQANNVERLMDSAQYEAAHPDDTLVLAGPPRLASVLVSQTTGIGSLLAIGMLQQVQWSTSKPTQPMMAIGSGRSFYVSGKSQTSWSMTRLMVNGRNLLRVLMHNAVAGGIDVSLFDDPAALEATARYFTNLDSELYLIPFGLGAVMHSKSHDLIASFYSEHLLINNVNIGVTAGGNSIMESVSGVCDRMLPMPVTDVAASQGVDRATVDAVLGITDPITPSTGTGNKWTLDENTV
jgi:hypothetical protein